LALTNRYLVTDFFEHADHGGIAENCFATYISFVPSTTCKATESKALVLELIT
jgi:hypothetical protein